MVILPEQLNVHELSVRSKNIAKTEVHNDMVASDRSTEASSLPRSSSESRSLPPEFTPTFIRDELCYCLSSVRYAGSFISARTSQNIVDPGLFIENIGNVSLPVSLEHAKAIMRLVIRARLE